MSDAELRATVDAKLPWLLGAVLLTLVGALALLAGPRVEARPPTPPTIFLPRPAQRH